MTSTRPPTDTAAAARAARGHVVLLGLMGTGKTVVARALAPHLGVPHTDSDAVLTGTTELTAREIRDRYGVRVLHNLEARHLLDALDALDPAVVCAAASVVEDERCRAALRRPGLFRLWLRARPETLAARFHNESHRPVFSDDPLALFEHQMANRARFFLELSDAIVDVDGLAIDEVVERVIATVDARRQAAGGHTRTVSFDGSSLLAKDNAREGEP